MCNFLTNRRNQTTILGESALELVWGFLRGRSSSFASRVVVGGLLLALLFVAACESTQLGDDSEGSDSSGSGYHDFSGEAAWEHLEALVDIGPRVSGTAGSKDARAYLRAEMEEIGAEVEEYRFEAEFSGPAGGPATRSAELVNLVGVLPGDSEDIILLVAPYDTTPFDSFEFVGANGGASGPAVLLELGRVLASRARPYTLWLVFLDGDALSAPGPDPVRFAGSELLAKQWAESGILSRVRLGVFFDRVGDADLTIARDLWSHSVYRDLFWDAAHRLGYDAEFARNRGFESPASSHRAFLEKHLRRVVALVDNRYGAGEPPGSYWQSEDDTPQRCSAESLVAVGQVTLEALDEICRRLEKIDRFARSPL